MPNTSIVKLRADEHKNLLFLPLKDFSFTANQNSVPLMNFEIANAAKFFPIIFPALKHVAPYAVLGLGNKNVFVDEKGNWKKGTYLPLMFANYPFSLIESIVNDEDPRYYIGIRPDAPHFAQSKGLPLYTETGNPSETLKKIQESLASQFRRHQKMQPMLNELRSLDLIEERTVTVKANDVTKAVHGLHCVNRDKVLALPEETLERLKKNGVMEVLNAHWQSIRHISLLLEDSTFQSTANHEHIQ